MVHRNRTLATIATAACIFAFLITAWVLSEPTPVRECPYDVTGCQQVDGSVTFIVS